MADSKAQHELRDSRTLHELKTAEQRAKQSLSDAQKARDAEIAAAKAESVAIIEDRRRSMEAKSRALISKAEQEVAAERKKRSSENRVKVDAIGLAAGKKVGDAVDYVVVEFRKEAVKC